MTWDIPMHPSDSSKLHLTAGTQPLAVTIPEAVRLSGLSRSEIYRRLSTRDIEARKSGSRTLIVWESLKEHIERLPPAEFREPAT
jgi:predicted DNA-binding transcriptional regulator AlpA